MNKNSHRGALQLSKIRMGIIGCGGMAGSHQNAYSDLMDVMEITATCDIIPERAEKAAKNVGAEHAVTDYRDMADYVEVI
jgi:predicted dehydrogenase